MSKVSIILTSYNKPLSVGQSIESVLDQTEEDWELFVMDDNSNKETREIIYSYLGDPRISYFNSEINDSERYKTTRYAVLINEAIPRTSGQFLTYLTDDTFYLPNRLEAMTDYFSKNPSVEIVYSSQKVEYMNHQQKVMYVMMLPADKILTRAAHSVDHCSVMHSRIIAEKIYLKYESYWNIDPKYWFNADAEFWTRLNELEPFYPISEVLEISQKTPHSFQNLSSMLPETIPDGTIVKGLTEDLYLIDGQIRRFLTKEMFIRLKFNNIVEIPDPILFKYPEGKAVSEKTLPNQLLIKSCENEAIYYIQKCKKRLIKNSEAFLKYHFDEQKIIELDSSYLNQFSDGPDISESINQKTVLPDGILFSFDQKYYLSFENRLCFIQTDIGSFKLKLPLSRAVPLSKDEFTYFLQGITYIWEPPLI
ncbi:glycosyltransferase [Metabacillus herbersteinensis]|uniref:Glycosyltransferase n=1 Tax=Metabacillus herbersteinensis TaxID=283816 RepID=A0ABV6GEF2_9BACI